ncbi:DnaB-like helicase C-terminal domain-containing protein [Flavobacterium sp.]|uniref:DnaB-like helicase C-terminal domain-containing protein n=3 Tax=Flavobacterium sp. TaxID=239 RepID=UPI0040470C30
MKDFEYLESKTLKELGKEFIEEFILPIPLRSNKKIASGFDRLDVVIGGFQSSNLVLIGGVEGMGKTSLLISLIRKMAIEEKFVMDFFSLQLTSKQITSIIVSQQTKIPIEVLCSDKLSLEQGNTISKIIEEITNCKLKVYDYPFLTVSDIEEALLFYPPDYLHCVVIDSLQLVANKKNDKVGKELNKRELSQITYQLKKLAEKLNITIIVTTNLKVKRNKKSFRPLLYDIRKQAPIDTFADMVLLLYRPEYYKIDEWDDEGRNPTTGEAEINIVKNNGGKTGQVRIKFEGQFGLFDNLTS